MQDIQEKIVEELRKIVKDLTNQDITPEIFHPKDEEHGDYSSNIAMIFFKVSKETKVSKVSKGEAEWKTPLDLAKKIVGQFMIHNSKFIIPARAEAVQPGFINFFLAKDYLISQLGEIAKKADKFGFKVQSSEKKIIVEYSSPNIAKPFTIGHLRSTIIGDAVANLLEANGWKVYRDNHLGDWGSQFGRQIYAIKQWGKEEEILKSVNPVKKLFDLYVRFHQEAEKDPSLEEEGRKWFKKLEDGDDKAKELWKKCVEWSLKEFQKIYDQLGIRFTENNGIGYGESFFEDKMQEIIKELESKGILKESEGAKLVFFPSFGSAQDKYPPLMIVKKDGATLYATRDLATDKFRLNKYGKDVIIINEVGIEQSLYFKQLFEVEKMLGWVKDGQRIHLKHGHYRFKDEKMSTRKGNVIWLEEVLEEGVRRAYKLSSEEARETAKDVGIGAIKWNDLKRGSNLDIIFDWDEILNMEGNSGPYLQYTFARTQSVITKSEIRNPKSEINSNNQNSKFKKRFLSFEHSNFDIASNFDIRASSLQLEPEEVLLLRTIYRFPEVIEEAAGRFAPNILCNYLFDLAQKFNLFYQKHKIIGNVILNTFDKLSVNSVKNPIKTERDSSVTSFPQNDNTRDFRLALTAAVGQVIKNGLYLLGIQAPERM